MDRSANEGSIRKLPSLTATAALTRTGSLGSAALSDPTDPTLLTIKTRFALSCNVCSVPGCEVKLADPGWDEVNADIPQIHGRRPRSARYDASMSDEERRGFGNLMLVCPNHHRLIDRLEPEKYPAELLPEWKERHEQRCADARSWSSDEELDRCARLVLAVVEASTDDEPGSPSIEIRRADWGTNLQHRDVTEDLKALMGADGRLSTTASKRCSATRWRVK